MRIRPFLPLLLSSVALPAIAGDYGICLTASDSLGCMIEQAEFTRQRNAEIDASIARVEGNRQRELALSLTHCKSRFSRTPRCLAERTQRFAARQNELIEASMARVAEVRAFETARRAEAAASMAAVEARRTRELEISQKTLVEASMAAAETQRQRRFAAHQNALATASIERVADDRRRQLAWRLTPCTSQMDTRPRCEAQRAREFAAHQRTLAAASLERVRAERERTFAAARNAEVNASIAAVERARASSGIETATISATAATTPRKMSAEEYAALTSHCVRAPASPRCEAERIREFAAARNAEIERSLAAVARARAETRHAAANGIPDAAVAVSECRSVGYSSPACDSSPRLADVAVAPITTPNGYAAYTSHCVRSPDSPRCEAERVREFAAARNEEINRSIAAVAAARAQGQLDSAVAAAEHGGTPAGTSQLETGAISMPTLPRIQDMGSESRSLLRQDISDDPCRVKPFEALQFSRGSTLDDAMTPELDRLANAAQSCPGMRIEVHGYADGGSPFNNRNLSQQRAEAIADYLIASGVAPNRVAAMGRGGRQPALPYSEGYDPAFGGRVEFVVRDPSTDAAARRVMWDLAELLDPNYIPAVANLSP